MSRRFSNGSSFLAGFWIFLWFPWCTCSKTSPDSASRNMHLAVATPGKNILTALQKQSPKVSSFSLFWLNPWAPENSVSEVLRIIAVVVSVTVIEGLFASKKQNRISISSSNKSDLFHFLKNYFGHQIPPMLFFKKYNPLYYIIDLSNSSNEKDLNFLQ